MVNIAKSCADAWKNTGRVSRFDSRTFMLMFGLANHHMALSPTRKSRVWPFLVRKTVAPVGRSLGDVVITSFIFNGDVLHTLQRYCKSKTKKHMEHCYDWTDWL